MIENDRKRRSKWDNKEENQISTHTNERNARQERESYPRHLGDDSKSYDLDPDDVMISSKEPSPRIRDQREANRDSSDISRSRRPGDMAKSYPVSPRNHEPGQQNHFRSPERTRDYSHRSIRSLGSGRGRSQSPSGDRNRSRSPNGGRYRSRSPNPSRGRERDRGYERSGTPPNDYRRGPHGPSGGRNRSRSPSGGRNRSWSPSPRGRERDRGYGRSGSPPANYRRDPHGGFNDRRGGFRGPSPQVCRNFTTGDCRRGSQCRFLHPENPNPRGGEGHSERDQPQRYGQRGERGGSRYDVEREDLARNKNLYVCNDFLKGRCNRGSSCRFSHEAAGENSHERQHHIAPCKFFMMGNCSRPNCKFAHDAPMQDDHEVAPRDDRRSRDHGEKNSSWNGPTWEEAEKSAHHSIVNDGGWSRSTIDDVVGGSNVGGAMGWGDTGTQNLVKTNDDECNHLDDESEKWIDPDNHDVDMEIAGSEAPNETTKIQTHSTLDSMQYHTPYEFSEPTSIVAHTEIPENSQLYGNKMEGNVSTGQGFDSVNSGNVNGNAKQTIPMPEQDCYQHLEAYSVPPQQFSGMGQGKLVNSHNVEYNDPVQENISHFQAQNSIETQHVAPVNPVTNLSMPQVMEHKPVQMSNLPPMTEKFVNEQLPQLYAVLNPPKPEFSINTQPHQTSIYQKRNSYGTEHDQNQVFSSISITQIDDSLNNNQTSSQLSLEKMASKPVPEEPSKQKAEKPKEEAQNNGAGNVEADKKDGDGGNSKDDKAMRLFKNSLVEFVKDILKPKWKEGGMSRDVYKAIVKKVVDKVTGATQGVNIPSTQAKLDQYLESSRPKLAKLVEAYVERYAKTS